MSVNTSCRRKPEMTRNSERIFSPDFNISETTRNTITTGTSGCQRLNIRKMKNVEGSQKGFSSCHQAMTYHSIIYRRLDMGMTSGFKSWFCHLLGLSLGKSCKIWVSATLSESWGKYEKTSYMGQTLRRKCLHSANSACIELKWLLLLLGILLITVAFFFLMFISPVPFRELQIASWKVREAGKRPASKHRRECQGQ